MEILKDFEGGTFVKNISQNITNVMCYFFFQAEDGIRDWSVTGVQTCALPIFTPKLLVFMICPLMEHLKYLHK